MADYDDFDGLDDFDDLDFEGGSGTSAPSDDRNPVTSIARSAGADLINSFDEYNRTDTIKDIGNSIFGQMSVDPGKSDSFVSGLNSLNREAVNTLKREGGFIGEAAEDLLPDDGILGGVKDLLTSFFKEREDYSSSAPDYDAMAQSAVEAALGAIPQVSAEERIKNTRESMVNLDNNKLLASINTELIHARTTTSDVHAKFLRASLSVQFKHLYVAKESLELQKTHVASTRDQLEGVIKNTALPDFLKLATTEMIAQQAMQRVSSGLLNKITSKGSDEFAAVSDRLKSTISDNLGELSGLNDMRTMGGEMSVSEMVSYGLVEGTKQYAGGKIGNVLKKTKWGSNLVDKYDDFLSDKSGYLRGKATGSGFMSDALNFVADALDTTSNDYGGTVGKIAHRDTASQFTAEVKTSIVRVIPGLLSKILSAVSKQDEIQYDYNSGIFRTAPKNLSKNLEGLYAKNDSAINNVRRASQLVDRMEAATGNTINPELKGRLSLAILRSLNSGNRITINNLESNLDLSSFTESDRAEVVTLIAQMKDKGKEQGDFKSNNRDYVANAFEAMQSNRQDPSAWIEEQIRQGNTSALISEGLIKANGNGGYTVVKSKVDSIANKASTKLYANMRTDRRANPNSYKDDINDMAYSRRDDIVNKVDGFLIKLLPDKLLRLIGKAKTGIEELSQMDREQLGEAFEQMKANAVTNFEAAKVKGKDYKKQADASYEAFREGYVKAAAAAGLTEQDLGLNGDSLKFNYRYASKMGKAGIEELASRLNQKIADKIESNDKASEVVNKAAEHMNTFRKHGEALFTKGEGLFNVGKTGFTNTFNPSAHDDFAQNAYGGYVDPVAAAQRFGMQNESLSLSDLSKIVENGKKSLEDIRTILESDELTLDADRSDYVATAGTLVSTVTSSIHKAFKAGRLSFKEHGSLMLEVGKMTATLASLKTTSYRKRQGKGGAAINISPTTVSENEVIDLSSRSISKISNLFRKLNAILNDNGKGNPQNDIDSITDEIMDTLKEHNDMIEEHLSKGTIDEGTAKLLKQTLSNHISTSRLEGSRKKGLLGGIVTADNVKESLQDKALVKKIDLELNNSISSKDRENKLLNIIASQLKADDGVRAGSWLNQFQNNKLNKVDENGAIIQGNIVQSTGVGKTDSSGIGAKLGMAALGTMLFSSLASASEVGDIEGMIKKASEQDTNGYSTMGALGKSVLSGVSSALQFEGFDGWNNFIEDNIGSKDTPEGKDAIDNLLINSVSGISKFGTIVGGGFIMANAAKSLIGLAGSALWWLAKKSVGLTARGLWETTKFLAGNSKYNPLRWLGKSIIKGFGNISFASTKALIGASISSTMNIVKGLFGASGTSGKMLKGANLPNIMSFMSKHKKKLIFGGIALGGTVAGNASEGDTLDADINNMEDALNTPVADSYDNIDQYITAASAAALLASGLGDLGDLGDGKRGKGKKGLLNRLKSWIGRGVASASSVVKGVAKKAGPAGVAYGVGSGLSESLELQRELGISSVESVGVLFNALTMGVFDDYLISDKIANHYKQKALAQAQEAKATNISKPSAGWVKVSPTNSVVDGPKQSPVSDITDALIERISQGEGTGGPKGFSTVYGHHKFDSCTTDLSGIDITTLTITELYKYMAKYSANVRCYNRRHKTKHAVSHAAGKLQFMSKTLKYIVGKSKDVTESDRFSPNVQLRLGHTLLEVQCDYGNWLKGTISNDQFLTKLSRTWASIPNPDTNKSTYNTKGQLYAVHGGTAQPSHGLSEWRAFLDKIRSASSSELKRLTGDMAKNATHIYKGGSKGGKTTITKNSSGYEIGKKIGESIATLFGFKKEDASSTGSSSDVKRVPTKAESAAMKVDLSIEHFSADAGKKRQVIDIKKGTYKHQMIVIDSLGTHWGVNLPSRFLTETLKHVKNTTTQPYHFVINADGTLVEIVSLDSTTGLFTKRGNKGGIEIALAGGLNTDGEPTVGPPTMKQLTTLMNLVQKLATLYKIDKEKIVGANGLYQDDSTGVFPTHSFLVELRDGKWRVSKDTAKLADREMLKKNKGTTASGNNSIVRDIAPITHSPERMVGDTKSKAPIITVAQDPTTKKLASTMEASFNHTRTSNDRMVEAINKLVKQLEKTGNMPSSSNTGGSNPTTRGGTPVANMVPTN